MSEESVRKHTTVQVHGTATDIYTPEKRSEIMRQVCSRNTKPEMIVRSALHAAGFRFRLHRKDLPGKPDIVLPMYRTVIFAHGCFWHQHGGCKKATLPVQNADFWRDKLKKNVVRDERNIKELERLGWQVLIMWECEIKAKDESFWDGIKNRIKGSNKK